MSFPHFLHGDPSLRNNVMGLSPDPEKHDMYVDIHRTLGLTIGGTSRLQLNVQVRQAAGVMGATMTHFKDLSILPVAWFELVSGCLRAAPRPRPRLNQLESEFVARS